VSGEKIRRRRKKKGNIQEWKNITGEYISSNSFSNSILDFEKNYRKRNISEMIHKEQKNGLNLMEDTELLDNSYFNILDIREHK